MGKESGRTEKKMPKTVADSMKVNFSPPLHFLESRIGRSSRGGGGAGAEARQEDHRQARGEGQGHGGRSG